VGGGKKRGLRGRTSKKNTGCGIGGLHKSGQGPITKGGRAGESKAMVDHVQMKMGVV